MHTVYGPRYECCGLWSWSSSQLVDKETHQLRKLAHKEFDPLWKTGKMTRTQAYKYLAWKLKLPYRKCHMKLMKKEQLKKVLRILEKERG